MGAETRKETEERLRKKQPRWRGAGREGSQAKTLIDPASREEGEAPGRLMLGRKEEGNRRSRAGEAWAGSGPAADLGEGCGVVEALGLPLFLGSQVVA